MAVSYQYFSYLVLHIFPQGYFSYHERCLVSHQHLRAFGLCASDLCPDLLTSLSVVLKQDHLPEKELGTLSYKLKEGDMAVNDVSVINDEKKTVKNRTAFFVLMEKVGEMYLNGMMLSEMEHPNLLPLVDVLMFKGFPFLLKMALKSVTKQQAKAVKQVKTEMAQLAKLKVQVDTDSIRNIAEKVYGVFVAKMSNSDFNVNLKQTLEDKKLDQ